MHVAGRSTLTRSFDRNGVQVELSSRFLSRFDVVLVWCFLLLTLLLASFIIFGTISKTLDSLYVTFSMYVWRCHFYHPLFLLQWVLLGLQFWQIYLRRNLKIMELVLSPLDHFSGAGILMVILNYGLIHNNTSYNSGLT